MPTVIGVKLRFAPKTAWFDPAGVEPESGQRVIVETERGREMGEVVEPAHEVDQSALPGPLKPIVRMADTQDLELAEELAAKEQEALAVYRELVAKHKLDMKPIDVEYMISGDKITFYFVAEERVDFRELVKELATRFKARIDMRQVGVRDEARMVGGLGHCGQVLCCVRFAGEFQPVSIRMAKEQDLPLNPLKISGLCGRLMCCLRYEHEAYRDFKTRAPRKNAVIETPVGLGKVVELSTPREIVTLRLEDGTRVPVPLAAMDCSGGSGCPCKVDPEAFEQMAQSSLVVSKLLREKAGPVVEEDSGTGAEPRREPRPGQRSSEPRPETRRRRRRGGGGGEAAKAEPAGKAEREQQRKAEDAVAGQASKDAEKGSAKPSASSRRRRRRRRSGGGGGSGTPDGGSG